MSARARWMRRLVLPAIAGVAALAAAGCGTTEKTGSVGDELTANGIQVTVSKVTTDVPVPANDVTGLSAPSPGSRLAGALAKVCSNHGGAIGSYDFGMHSTDGDGKLKFPESNLSPAFDTVRSDCGTGWVVFEIPAGAKPTSVSFGFQDTGSAEASDNNQVNARFTWNANP